MPNIQICGFSEKAGRQVKDVVDCAVKKIGLENEAITDVITSQAECCYGCRTSRPYLRICSTDAAEIKKIIDALKKENIREDVEWLVLGGFIPKEKMHP